MVAPVCSVGAKTWRLSVVWIERCALRRYC